MRRFFQSELVLSLVVLAPVGLCYAWQVRSGVPTPGSGVGRCLGIAGFLLMLSAETLYTIRKRVRGFTLGRMSFWLQMHVFCGIVGSALVLLHAAGRFQGVAGLAAGLTIVMVISGFVGRYLYTAVPRTLDGTEIGVQELFTRFAAAERRLSLLGVQLSTHEVAALEGDVRWPWFLVLLGRPLLQWQQQRSVRQLLQRLPLADKSSMREIETLLTNRLRLQWEIRELFATRRWLAAWHLFHVPVGLVLFVLAFTHVFGAMYYSRLLN